MGQMLVDFKSVVKKFVNHAKKKVTRDLLRRVAYNSKYSSLIKSIIA